jgi:CheY-like chemotaxis protein
MAQEKNVPGNSTDSLAPEAFVSEFQKAWKAQEEFVSAVSTGLQQLDLAHQAELASVVMANAQAMVSAHPDATSEKLILSLQDAEVRIKKLIEEKSQLLSDSERSTSTQREELKLVRQQVSEMESVMSATSADHEQAMTQLMSRSAQEIQSLKAAHAQQMAAIGDRGEDTTSNDANAMPRIRRENRVRNSPRVSRAPAVVSRKVLVVDDAEINRVLMGHYFKFLPIDLEFCSSGEDAIARCHTHKYDLIIMDLQMKNMTGLEAVLKIREFEKNTAILAISNLSPEEMHAGNEQAEAMAAGCNHYAGKGMERDSFTQKVEEILFAS